MNGCEAELKGFAPGSGFQDEFGGVGKAMLITPGQHRLRIALPGYLPFDTMVRRTENCGHSLSCGSLC
jgi:hypothetical protein